MNKLFYNIKQYNPLYVFFCIILFCCEAKTQNNLVPNGSFEIYDTCPQYPNQLHFAHGWFRATSASSDYFNSCDLTGYVSTPHNFYGNTVPFHGNAYAGFGYTINGDYTEYIGTKLSDSLLKDTVYYVSFYIVLSGQSKYAINAVGLYLSKDSIDDNSSTLSAYNPQILTNTFVSDTLNWTKVYSLYTATGGEKFVTIGVFKPYTLIDTIRNPFGVHSPYYYVDSVSVCKTSQIINNTDTFTAYFPNVFSPNNDGVNDMWHIKSHTIMQCTIYNRWGQEVYADQSKEIKWGGTTKNGENCPDGYYYYIISTVEKRYKGFIQLIR